MVSYGRNPENRIIARSRRLSRAAMGMAGRFLPIRFRMACAADVQTRLSSNLRFCCRPANSCSCRAGSRLPDLSQSQKGAGRSFSDQPAPVAFFFQVSFPKSLRRRQLRLRFPVIGSSARPLSSGKSAYLRKISIPETRSGILIPESCGCSAPCGGNPDCPSSSCGGTPAAAPVFRQGSARRTPADDSRGRYAPP